MEQEIQTKQREREREREIFLVKKGTHISTERVHGKK